MPVTYVYVNGPRMSYRGRSARIVLVTAKEAI